MSGAIRTLVVPALTMWCLCGPIAWVVRDGLGPGATDSHGWDALARFFWTFYWGPVFVVLVAAVILSGRRANKHQQHPSG